jgi:hypothetical protein
MFATLRRISSLTHEYSQEEQTTQSQRGGVFGTIKFTGDADAFHVTDDCSTASGTYFDKYQWCADLSITDPKDGSNW